MKIYKCDFCDSELGTLITWHPSKQAADRDLRSQQKARGHAADGPEGVQAVEIPTGKAGLIKWLNTHFTTNNG